MRLHGCILATLASKPLLAIEYDPKIRAVLQDVGQSQKVIPLSEIDQPRAVSIIASGMDTSNDRIAQGTASEAQGLSAQGPRLLARSLEQSRLPPISPSLEQRVKGLAALGLGFRSIMNEALSNIAGMARHSVNTGDAATARPILKMLQLHDPLCGEWHYLEAIVHSSSGGDPEITHRMLDRAMELGFDQIWIRYVRACTYAAHGRKSDAARERDEAQRENSNHPAISGFDTLV
jgi:hypothetical protein